MAVFTYKATDRLGKLVTGSIEAKDRRAVITRLQESNYFPIKVEEKGKTSAAAATEQKKLSLSFGQRVKKKDVLIFTSQLATLTSSGVPLDRSLTVLTELTENKKLSQIIADVQKNVHGGSHFTDALARHPRVFSKLYVSMVKAGESGGVLENVLSRLADFLESSQEFKESVSSALVYPVLLTLVGGGAVVVLLTFVVPKFTQIFADMGQTLPLSTRLLLGFSGMIVSYWWVIAGLIALLVLSVRQYLKTESGKWQWDSLKLRLPVLGNLTQKIEVSRFSRTLGTLVQSGVPILQSLAIVKDIMGNAVLAKAIKEIQGRIKEGEKISEPLLQCHLFPPMAIHMIDVGEETGQLEPMLFKVADAYDRETRTAIKRMVSMLEPALILVMGLVVGFIVISMLMAIFGINDIPM
ncbi:MAG: type II secretion system inner membrane protein GspF [bacterium]